METRIQMWGNSLALRIPKPYALAVGLEADTPVLIELTDGKLTIAPVINPLYSLTELLDGITEENMHTEVDTGSAYGKEDW